MRTNKKSLVIRLLILINISIFPNLLAQEIGPENDASEIKNLQESAFEYVTKAMVQEAFIHHIEQVGAIVKYDTVHHYLTSEGDFVKEIDNENIVVFDTLYSPGILYRKGYQDGRIFYKNKGNFWGAFGAGIASPFTYFIPLAAGIAMAATPPNERNLRYNDTRMLYNHSNFTYEETNELFNDINYSRGYKKGAHNRKLGNVAGGYGAGLGSGVLVTVVVLVAILSTFH